MKKTYKEKYLELIKENILLKSEKRISNAQLKGREVNERNLFSSL